MLLCLSVCGGFNIIAFSWGCSVHISVRPYGEALILPLSELECFLLGLARRPLCLGEAFGHALEEVESVFCFRCSLLLSLLFSLPFNRNNPLAS